MFVCPAIAALLVARRESAPGGAQVLLQRPFDFKHIGSKAWYVPILFLNPAIAVSSYAVLHLIGTPVPAPDIQILPTLALFAVFFIAAVCEELGWSGYAIDPMQDAGAHFGRVSCWEQSGQPFTL